MSHVYLMMARLGETAYPFLIIGSGPDDQGDVG